MSFGSEAIGSVLVGAGMGLLPDFSGKKESDCFTREDFSPETVSKLEASHPEFFSLDSKSQRAIIKQKTDTADELIGAKDGLVQAVRENRVQVANDGRVSTQGLKSVEYRLLASSLVNLPKGSKDKVTKIAA